MTIWSRRERPLHANLGWYCSACGVAKRAEGLYKPGPNTIFWLKAPMCDCWGDASAQRRVLVLVARICHPVAPDCGLWGHRRYEVSVGRSFGR